ASANTKGERALSLGENWSGKGVSNSRPQPWQGCALPTELFPRRITNNYSVCAPGVKNSCLRTRLGKNLGNRVRDVVDVAGIECGDADSAGIDRVYRKFATQARNLVRAQPGIGEHAPLLEHETEIAIWNALGQRFDQGATIRENTRAHALELA